MHTSAFGNSIKDNKTDIYGVKDGKNGGKIYIDLLMHLVLFISIFFNFFFDKNNYIFI